MTKTANTKNTETNNVTFKELATIFQGKHVNVSPTDRYGISISVRKGSIEHEDGLSTELWLVSRDSNNNVTSSICISEDSVENIEQYGDTYTINFTHDITSVDVSECKTV